MKPFIEVALLAVGVYLALGSLFTIGFQVRGLPRLDAGSRGSGIGFRLLITPGIITLWPWLALRWWRLTRDGSFPGDTEATISPQRLRTMHGLAWKALMVLAPLLIAAALWRRPERDQGSSINFQTLKPRVAPAAITPP